ncbi:MAG: hypothetical protein F4Y86_03315 [Gammaproteobacteria bacterium]|nr:hypothetical protein [Gammaproteobacteria bacterium]
MIKYIPAESVAFYLLADRIVSSRLELSAGQAAAAAAGPRDAALVWSWVVFIVALLGTPAYLRMHRSAGQPWKAHAAISSFAFACWAYAVGGSAFVAHGLYDPLLGGLAVALFTYGAGMFRLTVHSRGS